MGFPSWGGGSQELNEKTFSKFTISIDGEPVEAQWQNGPLKLGNETRAIRWLAFGLSCGVAWLERKSQA